MIKMPPGVAALSGEAAAMAVAIRRAQRKYKYPTPVTLMAVVEALNFLRAQHAHGKEPHWVELLK